MLAKILASPAKSKLSNVRRSNPVGRPSDYTPELVDLICLRVALGENLNVICEDKSMPAQDTVYRWRKEHKEFSEKYFESTIERSHARIDRIDAISRKVESGLLEPAAAAVILKAETWQAGRENPKRYGDKIVQEHTGTLTLEGLVAASMVHKPEA